MGLITRVSCALNTQGLSEAWQGTLFLIFSAYFHVLPRLLPIQLHFAALRGGTRGSGSHTHQPLCPPAVLLQLGRDGLQGGLWVAERDSTQGSWSSKLHLHLNSSAPPYAGYSTFQTNFQEKAHKWVCHKLAFFAVQEKVCTIYWLHVHRDSTRAEQACSQ